MRGPCESCGQDDGHRLRRSLYGHDMMLCAGCYADARRASLEEGIEDRNALRCHRCGGRHALQVIKLAAPGLDGKSVEAEIRLCLRCRNLASTENSVALGRRTHGGIQ